MRRYATLLLACCLISNGGIMRVQRRTAGVSPVTLIQKTDLTTCFSVDTCAVAFSGANTLGSTLMTCALWDSGTTGHSIASVFDTQSNTGWAVVSATLVTKATANYPEMGAECAVATNVKAGSNTVSVDFVIHSAGHALVAIFETTPANATPVDQTSTGQGTTGTTQSAGTVTTAANGEFSVSVAIGDDGFGSGDYTAGSGWTLAGVASGGNGSEGAQYIQQSTAGSLSGSMTAPRNSNWLASMVTVKP